MGARLSKCRSVVYAVANHGDNVSLILQSLDDVELLFRHDLRNNARNTNLLSNMLSGCLVVSGQQDRLNPQSLELLDCGLRRVLHGVANNQNTVRVAFNMLRQDPLSGGRLLFGVR